VVTDSSGQYRITELPPGTYSLTFTLPGFTTVKRPEIVVSGSGVTPINTELRVGALQETITVVEEAPLVDTQSTRREMVLTNDTINALPATRSYGALLNAIPGLSTNTGSTSAMATPDMTFFTANGGRQNGGQVQIDGMPVAASFNGGGVSTFTYDIANAAEMQVLVSGGLGEAENGEPRINLVPQSGGNRFRGQGFYSGAGTMVRGQQHHQGTRRRRHHETARHRQALGRERIDERPGAARSVVVLRQHPSVRQLPDGRGGRR
jgi:hypothetical protein